MDLKKKRADLLAEAKQLVEAGDVEAAQLKMDEASEVTKQIKSATQGSNLLKQIAALGEDAPEDARDQGLQKGAASLGEHFVKTALPTIQAKAGEKYSVSTTEWMGPAKAATDTQATGTVYNTPVLTEFDRTIIRAVRPELVVADLLGQGTITGNAVSYFIETGPAEGAFSTVAEGAAKPQLHFPDPTTAIDSLKKIAGFIKFTDEMMEDLGFVVTEINNRLLYELYKFEETQLLNGNGTGTNVLGLLNRSGIQLASRAGGVAGNAADDESVADAIFRSMTLVRTGSGLEPDGIVIHPLDYQTLRLSKDANGQYFGGGYFQGQYGNGAILQQPPIWGMRTVVSTAVAQGTVLVGAFTQGATLYRKGGVRVESTNSHGTDFTENKVTTRAEERIALAVRRPAAFVKLSIATPA